MIDLVIIALVQVSLSEPSPTDYALLDECILSQENAALSCRGEVVNACLNNQSAPQTNSAMIACTQREQIIWQGRMSVAYKALINELEHIPGRRRKDSFRQAQYSWVEFRQSECEQRALQYDGGTLMGLVKAVCLNDLTAIRALDLEQQLAETSL